jgi:hypothetical protein
MIDDSFSWILPVLLPYGILGTLPGISAEAVIVKDMVSSMLISVNSTILINPAS